MHEENETETHTEVTGQITLIPSSEKLPMQMGRDAKTLVRSSDPDTSQAAARLLSAPKAGSMRRRLLDAFRMAPWTAEEAAGWAGYEPVDGAWKRVSDLLSMGLIRDSGARKEGSSGRLQRILVITEKGRELLRQAPTEIR